MNYILQLNAFMEKVSTDPEVKTPDRFVYVALFYLNNLAGWREKFFASYSDVMNLAGLSAKDTYYKALANLEGKGFIKYYPGRNRYEAPSFTLLLLYHPKESRVTSKSNVEVTNKESRVTSKSNKYKLTKPSKLIKKIETIGTSEMEVQTKPLKFSIPSKEEIKVYMVSKKDFHNRGAEQFAEKFWSFYDSNGWKVGKNPMKSWTSAVATWVSSGEYVSFIRKNSDTLAQSGTKVTIETPGAASKPAPVALSKDESARQVYGQLLTKIRRTNELSEWELWEDIYRHLTTRGRTQRVDPEHKKKIRETVRTNLLRAAENKALNSSPAIKPSIMADALKNLDYECKKQFCKEYLSKLIKTPTK